jgi:hypothetical protein
MPVAFSVGNQVKIRDSERSPYRGSYGVISSVDPQDERAPYLVRFEDGIQFRYKPEEVELPQATARNHFVIKITNSNLYRTFAALLFFSDSFPRNNQPRFHPSVPLRFGTRQS